MIKNLFLLLAVMLLLSVLGCSNASQTTVSPPGPTDVPANLRDTNSGRISMGAFGVLFDADTLSAEIVPLRTSEIHYNISYIILPQFCPNCIEAVFNGFDVGTQILDADIILRNHTNNVAYDVRVILQTTPDGYKLLDPDDWTMRFDNPGGSILNPFKAYAKTFTQRQFSIGAQHTRNFEIWVPDPFNLPYIFYTITASWPDNSEEPYMIHNFVQDGVLTGSVGSSTNISIDVYDWQNDTSKVTLYAPAITGQNYSQFIHSTGNTWIFNLVNNTGIGQGEYEGRIIATSTNSPGVALYDFVTITIS